jgi:putative endonuclease
VAERLKAAVSPLSFDRAPRRMTGANTSKDAMYYVYFLMQNDTHIYTGSTSDLKSRINTHNLGKVISTKHKRPLMLLGYEGYALKTDAQRREKYLKTTEGKRLLKQQYRDIINKLNGDVAERLKAAVSNTAKGESSSEVRILSSPPQ